MIFYGDAARPVATEDLLRSIAAELEGAVAAPLPIDRHAALAAALIAAGGLAQGLGDAALAALGHDNGSPLEAAALRLARCLAAALGRSWEAGWAPDARTPRAIPADAAAALAALRREALPGDVTVRRTEGFSHYALYPESYWAAARREPRPRPAGVIGLRSIGTTLAATVAAALGAETCATLRPAGHPFARVVAPGPALDAAVRRGAGAPWAVVDEGPGLSGSSFAAAAAALTGRGVALPRVTLYPSHAHAPGAMAAPEARRLWAGAAHAHVPFEALMLDGPAPPLAAWVADLVGAPVAPPRDLGGGAWRAERLSREADWPAVDRQNERRKVLIAGEGGRALLKFTGLGAFGRAKHARAASLAAAGFGLPPLAWRHGFIVEPWRDDLPGLDWPAPDRAAVLDHLARYLAFRARSFPADRHDGAPLPALHEMARANVGEAIGEDATRRLSRWEPHLPALAAASRPVAVDGRLAPHEWLRGGPRGLLKTDALDHCAGHDLVGCQDIAWDVAGAAAEFALSDGEVEALRAGVERRSRVPCDARLVAYLRIAYPAFAAGALALARGREDGAEAARLDAAFGRQVAALARALG